MLLYDCIPVTPTGVLTSTFFAPSRDGRRIHVSNSDDTGRFRYFVQTTDGKLTPFHSDSGMATGISWLESKFLPQSCYLYSVNMSPFEAKASATADAGFRNQLGKQVVAHISFNATAQVFITDPELLVDDYLYGDFSTPEQGAAQALTTAVYNELRMNYEGEALEANLHGVYQLGRDVSNRVADQIPLRWAEFRNIIITTRIENENEVVSTLNEYADWRKSMVDRAMDAMLAVYQRPVFSPELSNALVAYLQANPMCSNEQLMGIAGELHALGQKGYSTSDIVQVFYQLMNDLTGGPRRLNP